MPETLSRVVEPNPCVPIRPQLSMVGPMLSGAQLTVLEAWVNADGQLPPVASDRVEVWLPVVHPREVRHRVVNPLGAIVGGQPTGRHVGGYDGGRCDGGRCDGGRCDGGRRDGGR